MVHAGPLWYSLAILVGMAGYAAIHHGLLAYRRRDQVSVCFSLLASIIVVHGVIRLVREHNGGWDLHITLDWWQWLTELLAIPAYLAFLLSLTGRSLRAVLPWVGAPTVLLLGFHLVHDGGYAVARHGAVYLRSYAWGENLYAIAWTPSWGYFVFAVLAVTVVFAGAILAILHLRRNCSHTTWCLVVATGVVVLATVAAIMNDLGILSHFPLLIDHAFVGLAAVMGLGLGDEVIRLATVERDLALSRGQLAGTLESVADAVVLIGPDGRIAEWNAAAELLTGVPAAEAIGQQPAARIELRNLDQNQQIQPWSGEQPAGPQGPARLRESIVDVRVVDLGPGRRDGRLLVLRDVTAAMRQREVGEHARRMESIGHLAGGVAHDYNNLLAAILGSAELIKLKSNNEVVPHIEAIFTATEQARSLSDQLLTFSRKGSARRQRFAVHEAIGDAVALLRRSLDPRIRIEADLRAEQQVVSGDRRQLANALLNLGINARDAMPGGGWLRIATRGVVRDGQMEPTAPNALGPGSYLEIAVSDSGTGIEPDILPRIFEPYFTTKAIGAGTGLGLASVYGCIAEIGGAISVESAVAVGTTFRIWLPAEGGTATAAPSTRAQTESSGSSRTVLVVDDDELVRPITVGLIQALGYHCIEAGNGTRALSLLHEQHVDLIFLDAVMPGENGLAVMRRIRELGMQTPIVLCSGYGDGDDVDAMRSLGLAGILRKPYRYEDMEDICARALSQRALR